MFLEALVRVAECKFKTSGQEQTFARALDRLIEENIEPNWPQSKGWMGFRLNWLWCVDVNDTFHANYVGMQQVYEAIVKSKKGGSKKVTLDKCINIFAKQLDAGLSEQ